MRIAHISDLHVLELAGASALSFLNKRATGAVNLALHRAHTHDAEVVEQALAQIADQGVDHLVVTGDLSNLSLESEFERVARMLRNYGDNNALSVIPGNHDHYTYTAARKQLFERYFTRWMHSALPELVTQPPYPYVKLLDEVAIIGLCSAVPTPPLMATGRVSNAQLKALKQCLSHEAIRARFVVVLVHHPLGTTRHGSFDFMRRLRNAKALRTLLLQGQVDLVLHGHNHESAFAELPHPTGDRVMRVIEAGSTSVCTGPPERAGKFNIYHLHDRTLARIESWVYDPEPQRFVPWKDRELS